MSAFHSDRNLLIGVAALQLGFVTREELVDALTCWVRDKSKSLESVFVERCVLDLETCDLVRVVVDKQLARNDADTQRTLTAVGSLDDQLRDQLESLGDTDLTHSVSSTTQRQSNDAPLVKRVASPVHDSKGSQREIDNDSVLRYRKLREHAKGGLGVVSVALDVELNREVALKEIQSRYAHDIQSQSRFTIEAEVTGNLEHPGIVPVYGMGNFHDGTPYYAMRFIKGESLKEAASLFHSESTNDMRRAYRGMTFRRLLRRFVDVCNAVEYAHSRGVVHRDLKPSNIMLGKYGETLVVDWGLAKVTGRATHPEHHAEDTLRAGSGSSVDTQMGMVVGTPQYMSPEQAAGKVGQLDARSDVYSLGATLYFLLTGRSPFEVTDLDELITAVSENDFSPPRNVHEATPKALDAICMKAMSKDADDRYETPTQLADEIESWLGDEAVTAYAEPRNARAWRWIRHHQTLVSSGAIATFVGLVSLFVITGIVSRSNRDLTHANDQLDVSNAELRKSNGLLEEANSNLAFRNTELEQAYLRIQHEERKVREERDIAEALNDFVRFDLLSRASPYEEPVRDIRLRAVLDRAASSLQDRFAEYPLVEAEIASIVGNTYSDLGEYDLAGPLLDRARELMREQRGDEHPRTLSCLNNIALLLIRRGEIESAETILASTYSDLVRVKGAHDRETLSAAHNLSAIYRETARLDEAKELIENTIESLADQIGESHPQTLSSRNALAVLLKQSGQYTQAKNQSYDLVEDARNSLGENHPTTLLYVANYATACAELGESNEAKELYEAALNDMRAVLGERHHRTLASEGNLGLLYEKEGRLDKAESILRPLLPRTQAALGNDHPLSLRHAVNLAVLLTSQKRFVEAIELLESTLELSQQVHGESDVNTLSSMYNLATLYRRVGRLVEANTSFEKLVDIHQRLYSDDHPDTLIIRGSLAGISLQLGDADKAETIYLDILRRRRQLFGNAHPGTTMTANNLGYLYLSTGRLGEAEELLTEVYETRQRLSGDRHIDTLVSADNLASLFRAQERFDEAETLYRDAISKSTEEFGASHPNTITTQRNLGSMLGQLNRWDDSRATFQTAFDGAVETFGIEHRVTQSCKAGLAFSLLRLGQISKATTLLEELHGSLLSKPDPDHQDLYNAKTNLGVAYHLGGRIEEGRQMLEDALSEYDTLPAPLQSLIKQHLLEIYESLGETEKAEELTNRD